MNEEAPPLAPVIFVGLSIVSAVQSPRFCIILKAEVFLSRYSLICFSENITGGFLCTNMLKLTLKTVQVILSLMILKVKCLKPANGS